MGVSEKTRAEVNPLDFLEIDSLLSDEERLIRDNVRDYARTELLPRVAGWYEQGTLDPAVVRDLGKLEVLGMHLSGYGCAGANAVSYGLTCMELEAVDSGLRSLVSVQGSLAMFAIWRYGSEEQKEQWLPRMATGEAIGCFGLTESDAGSDPAAMRTTARRDGSDWVLNGSKLWITNGSLADIAVVWAATDEGIRGFLVERGSPGFTTSDIHGKLSLRASVTSELALDDVRVPESARLPEATSLGAPLACLNEARFGIIFGAMGAARSCYEAALEYAGERQVFDKPLTGFQLTQQKLVEMLLEVNKGSLLALHLGRLKDEERLAPAQVSFGKLSSTVSAIEVARSARTILGANGVSLEYPVMRHANNLESVLTYEGTAEVHTLIIGSSITGEQAFR